MQNALTKKVLPTTFQILHFHMSILVLLLLLGVKAQNMKMDFNTGGTWRQVGQ